MRSSREIKKIAQQLAQQSLTSTMRIDTKRVETILSLFQNGQLQKIGIRIEQGQVLTLFQEYAHRIEDMLIQDTITITTPIALSSEQQMRQESFLKRTLKKSHVAFVVDKELVGGVKMQIGWNIIDNSIKDIFRRLIS